MNESQPPRREESTANSGGGRTPRGESDCASRGETGSTHPCDQGATRAREREETIKRKRDADSYDQAERARKARRLQLQRDQTAARRRATREAIDALERVFEQASTTPPQSTAGDQTDCVFPTLPHPNKHTGAAAAAGQVSGTGE